MNGIKSNFERKRKERLAKREAFRALDKDSQRREIKDKIINSALYVLVGLLIIAVTIYNNKFVSWGSIVNILTLSSTRLILALGVAGTIVLAGTDLSVGRMVGLAACISASLMQYPDYIKKMWPGIGWVTPIVPLIIAMIICGIFGFFNGWMTAKFKMHPFIVTLGTQLIVFGLCLLYVDMGANQGAPIGGLDMRFTNLVLGHTIFRIPWVVWYAVIALIIMWVVWNKTVFGKNMFAVGSNEEAAAVSGVNVFWTIILVFTIAGVCYGVGGFLESARIGSNTAATGFGYELDAISAVVIGGVSFNGGVGKIRGVVIGVILLQIINAAMVFLNVDAFYTYIVRGAIILIACAIDMRKYVSKK